MKTRKLLGLILLIVMVLLACTLTSTPTPTPVVVEPTTSVLSPVADSLPFEGIWMTEGDAPEILVLSKDSMYRVQSDQASATEKYTREQFASVVSYDLEKNHISLRTQWIRVNATMSGFDAPNFNITYKVEGDALQIGIGWDEEFATETDPLVYHRK